MWWCERYAGFQCKILFLLYFLFSLAFHRFYCFYFVELRLLFFVTVFSPQLFYGGFHFSYFSFHFFLFFVSLLALSFCQIHTDITTDGWGFHFIIRGSSLGFPTVFSVLYKLNDSLFWILRICIRGSCWIRNCSAVWNCWNFNFVCNCVPYYIYLPLFCSLLNTFLRFGIGRTQTETMNKKKAFSNNNFT